MSFLRGLPRRTGTPTGTGWHTRTFGAATLWMLSFIYSPPCVSPPPLLIHPTGKSIIRIKVYRNHCVLLTGNQGLVMIHVKSTTLQDSGTYKDRYDGRQRKRHRSALTLAWTKAYMYLTGLERQRVRTISINNKQAMQQGLRTYVNRLRGHLALRTRICPPWLFPGTMGK